MAMHPVVAQCILHYVALIISIIVHRLSSACSVCIQLSPTLWVPNAKNTEVMCSRGRAKRAPLLVIYNDINIVLPTDSVFLVTLLNKSNWSGLVSCLVCWPWTNCCLEWTLNFVQISNGHPRMSTRVDLWSILWNRYCVNRLRMKPWKTGKSSLSYLASMSSMGARVARQLWIFYNFLFPIKWAP